MSADIPPLPPIPAELEAKIDEAVTHYPVSKRSAVLPLLHLIQEHFGFLGAGTEDWVAKKLELQPIHVYEVITFYPMFRRKPAGRHHVRVCRTLSCALGGGLELMENICALAKIDRRHVSHHEPIAVGADGKFSVEFVECLAACGTAPVCMVNDDFYENIGSKDAAKVVLEKYK
jgi:NADH-quinone oxidoreductase subunit E